LSISPAGPACRRSTAIEVQDDVGYVDGIAKALGELPRSDG
jgi:hypothetical protein